VIGMGIPTVVDLETFPEGEGDDLPLHRTGFLVTPREIDRLIDRGTRLLSMAINMAVNPMLDEAMYRSLL
jgi:spore protease